MDGVPVPVFKGEGSGGVWILQSDRVAGACSEGDRACVRDRRRWRL